MRKTEKKASAPKSKSSRPQKIMASRGECGSARKTPARRRATKRRVAASQLKAGSLAIAAASLLVAVISFAGIGAWLGSAKAVMNNNQKDATVEAVLDEQLQSSRTIAPPVQILAPKTQPAGAVAIGKSHTPKVHSKVTLAQRRKHSSLPRLASASPTDDRPSGASYLSGGLVAEARRYIGGNPTGRNSLWCGAFMDMVLKRAGHQGGGNLALGYLRYGERLAGPQVGAIAVMGRRGGGHVGVVSGIDDKGNPIVISGNHNRRVAESTYPRSRIIAYMAPH